jgi:hypothetical protein
LLLDDFKYDIDLKTNYNNPVSPIPEEDLKPYTFYTKYIQEKPIKQHIEYLDVVGMTCKENFYEKIVLILDRMPEIIRAAEINGGY